MPDLLAHVLFAYAVFRVLSWRFDWMNPQYITVGMAGAMVPDLAKVDLLFDDRTVEQFLGIPWDWFALHTAGGVLLSVLIGTTIVGSTERRRVFGLLSLGAATHLLADATLQTASGRSYSVLWPLVRYQPPTPGWFLSTDPTPTLIGFLLAAAAYLATRNRRD